MPFGVSGCTQQTRTNIVYFNNCRVSEANPVVSAGFFANYQFPRGAYASITSVRDAAFSVRGGTFSGMKLRTDRVMETASSPARATLEAQVTIYGAIASYTSRMTLLCGKGTARTTNNL